MTLTWRKRDDADVEERGDVDVKRDDVDVEEER